MPRSVIVLSSAPHLFDAVCSVLRSDSRFTYADEVVHCNGTDAPRTNIYPVGMVPATLRAREAARSLPR